MTTRDSYRHGEFCWVDYVAHDLAAAQKFYERVFGWRTINADTGGGPPYLMFQNGDKIVCGAGQMSEEMKGSGVPPMWNSYISVDDIHACIDKARSLGATIILPPMAVMSAGQLAFLKDPTGAVVGLWQKGDFAGAMQVNEPGCFCWNELATRDFAAARQFYGDLFGWEYRKNPESPARYDIIINQEHENGGIMEMTPEWGEIPPFWGVYFTVDSLDATTARLREHGGRLHCDPIQISIGRIAPAMDAQGAALSLIEMTEPIA